MMRRNYFLFTVILAIIVSMSFAGTTRPEIAITNADSDVKVIYEADEPCSAVISIFDNDGELVFKETIRRKQGFMRPYDLSRLPLGEYEVVVKNIDGDVQQKTVHNYKVEEELRAHVRLIGGKKRRYLLTIADQDNKTVEIEIRDDFNRRIYRKKRKLTDDYACIFVVKQVMPNEGLTFHIRNDEVSKYIRVN